MITTSFYYDYVLSFFFLTLSCYIQRWFQILKIRYFTAFFETSSIFDSLNLQLPAQDIQ